MDATKMNEVREKWNELNCSLEGGVEFAPFWFYGDIKRNVVNDTFYILHPQCTVRWEPHWFEYGILVPAFLRGMLFLDELEVQCALAIKEHPKTISQIAQELNVTEPEKLDLINEFFEKLSKNGLVISGRRESLRYLEKTEPEVSECYADLDAFDVPFPSAPLYTNIYLTYECNVDCIHCGTNRLTQQKSLSGDQWIEILERLRKAGVYNLTFNGGEPLMHPDINQILEYLVDSPFSVRVFTNGTLLDEQKIQILSKAQNFLFTISLDGATAEIHDDFRRRKGTFDKVMDAMDRLRKANPDIPCFAACVIHKNNLDTLEDVMKLAVEKDLSGVMYISQNYTDAMKKTDYYVSVQEKPYILDDLRKKAEKYQDQMMVSVQGRGPMLKEITRPIPQYHGHNFVCNAGIMDWMINPVGEVYPCEPVITLPLELQRRFYIGNLLEQTLGEVWNSEAYKLFRGEYTVDRLKGCPDCSNFELCAAKKCRLYSLTSNGDFDGPSYECQFVAEENGISAYFEEK